MEAGSPPQVVSKSTFVVKVGRYIGRYLGKIDHFHFLPLSLPAKTCPQVDLRSNSTHGQSK
jgi:hypothetical protein